MPPHLVPTTRSFAHLPYRAARCDMQQRVMQRSVRCQASEAPPVNDAAAQRAAPKAAMLSLGCAKNTVDGIARQYDEVPCAHTPIPAGEVLLGDLYRSGFEITDHADDADVIVVNTCGFIEDAKSESIDVRGHARTRIHPRVVPTSPSDHHGSCAAQGRRLGQEACGDWLPRPALQRGTCRYLPFSAILQNNKPTTKKCISTFIPTQRSCPRSTW